MKNLSDEELAILAQKNSNDELNEALDLLLDKSKYIASAVAHSYFICGGDLEDLIQEGTIALFKAIKTFSEKNEKGEKNSFKNYAYLCVKRRIFSVIKNSNRLKNKPLNEYLSLSGYYDNDQDKTEIIIDTESGPEDKYINGEAERELRQKIKETLSKYEYEIFSLFLKGYSYSEIGNKLLKKEKSIDNALQRIRKKILTIISEVD